VKFIWQGLHDAFWLVVNRDPTVFGILWRTLVIALWSTLWAMLVGLPLGLLLGLYRFRGRGMGLWIANAGLGLPPVVVGLYVSLLMFRGAPLSGFHLIYTVKGVILAQTVLAIPIVVALSAASFQSIDRGLIEQARALGASHLRVCAFALREARVGVLAATLGAIGACLSEVGAVVLVGGNIFGQTQTVASSILVSISSGNYAQGIALGTILLGLVLVVAAPLTLAQQRGSWR
jgi:tungstate transport system permease protein